MDGDLSHPGWDDRLLENGTGNRCAPPAQVEWVSGVNGCQQYGTTQQAAPGFAPPNLPIRGGIWAQRPAFHWSPSMLPNPVGG